MLNTIYSTEGTRRKLKKEFEGLVLLEVLERENDSEWGSPSFVQPKYKTSQVIFKSDLRHIKNN